MMDGDVFTADTLPSPTTGLPVRRPVARPRPDWDTLPCPAALCRATGQWRRSTRAATYAICRVCGVTVWYAVDQRLVMVPSSREPFIVGHVMAL